MTQEHIDAIIAEFERRWRERTPPPGPNGREYKSIDDILPFSKVPWSETAGIIEGVTGQKRSVDHRLEIQPHITKCLRRLRREFPDLKW
jgi:hypothetical protein